MGYICYSIYIIYPLSEYIWSLYKLYGCFKGTCLRTGYKEILYKLEASYRVSVYFL
nr:MAG TPA: hypothetical protein [Caudoviricetes sp.]DAT56686.1 MAG TPA: hypothetical protein [Caudoviricetes sp.]